jgi:hypothetical protein
MDNINKDKYTKYDDWCKFLWATRFSHFPNALEIADNYSKEIDGYVSKSDVENKMFDARSERIGWEYLMGLSKKSNLIKHRVLVKDNLKKETKKAKKEIEDAKQKAKEEKEQRIIEAEDLYEQQREVFERTHLKIINSGFYIREEINEFHVLSEKKIRETYKHIQVGWSPMGLPISFISRWIDCNNDIRYKKRIGVYPANNAPEDTFNIWKPFAMELVSEWEDKPSAIPLFKNHIDILCNHQTEMTEWFIRWLAFTIQHPEKKRGVMPVFVSEEGAGKNMLLQVLRKNKAH